VATAPQARAFLEQAPGLLEELEANLARADEAVAQAKDAYHGPPVLADAAGRALVMTSEAQENTDPGIVTAKAERSRWVVARSRVWQRQEAAREVLSIAEGRRPPGERPPP
jgi:hypothetical protein